MSRLYSSLAGACWVAGVLSMLAAAVVKLVPTLYHKTPVQPHGLLVLAGVLFLCVLATQAIERTGPPAS